MQIRGLERPPYALRARLLTPLDAGGTRFEPDGLLVVDEGGRINRVEPWSADAAAGAQVTDLRPLLLLPGLIDLHGHLPQLPNTGLGAGLDLLAWLERYIFPLERDFNAEVARRLAPAAFRAIAAAGTTTAVLYGAVYQESVDVSFAAAEDHGIRAVIGKVMMDRLRYDPRVRDESVLELSLHQSAELIDRWHGRDSGRLLYAVSPRFALSCTPEMLRESARLARAKGTYWQTHLAEDRDEVTEVSAMHPYAVDYTDVYDRAGALGPRAIMAHAVHLSDRELGRLVESGTRVVHCPASNQFLASGAMPLARYLEAGLAVGLGSDVAAGPELGLFAVMRAGAYTQGALRTMLDEPRSSLAPLDWLRMGSLEGARVLGLESEIGSLEAGKQADFICVDPSVSAPLRDGDDAGDIDDPSDIMSRLIFRHRPDAVLGAWVRGRRLAT